MGLTAATTNLLLPVLYYRAARFDESLYGHSRRIGSSPDATQCRTGQAPTAADNGAVRSTCIRQEKKKKICAEDSLALGNPN